MLRFEQFNTLNAAVSQIVPGGFRADLVASDDERREMAAKINWLKRRSLKQVDNKREGQRVHPRDPRAYLYVDGTEHACFVIDVSTSGIAISAKLSPPVGTALAVGRVSGKVVRHMEGGIGIQFDELQPPETLFEAIAVRRPVAEGAQGGCSARVVQHALEGAVAALGRALLRGVVDMHDAEARGIAFGPFVVVEQRPGEIAAHVGALLLRL